MRLRFPGLPAGPRCATSESFARRKIAIAAGVVVLVTISGAVLVIGAGCGSNGPTAGMPVATSNPTEPPRLPTEAPLATRTPVSTKPPQEEVGGTVLLVFGNRFVSSVYEGVRLALEAGGYDVVVASRGLGSLQAKDKDLRVRPDLILGKVRVEEYRAIVFTCDNDMALGNGRPETDRIAREAVKQGKVLAAICNAPMLLGYAGVLEGRKATGDPSSTCTLLESRFGATCTSAVVEQDGLIITGRDRWATDLFVQAILDALRDQ